MSIKKNYVLFFVLEMLLFVASFALYLHSQPGNRRMFRFPVVDSEKSAVEIRYLSRTAVQGDVGLYVDELLLGPETRRVRPLFSPGTRCEFCFVRGNTLYVGLSKDALHQRSPAAPILTGIDYLKKNVLRNFATINAIELFIGGQPVE